VIQLLEQIFGALHEKETANLLRLRAIVGRGTRESNKGSQIIS
jgi:hypothetical protein